MHLERQTMALEPNLSPVSEPLAHPWRNHRGLFLIHVLPYLQLSQADFQGRFDSEVVLPLPVVILSPDFLEMIIIVGLSHQNRTSRKPNK